MLYPTQRRFPAHKDCANFRSGICTINGVAIDPNASACPNFTPKNLMTRTQTRQLYKPSAPRIQSYPPYMPPYSPPSGYSSPPQTWRGYRAHYTTGSVPSTLTAPKGGSVAFLSMPRGRRGRGVRRGRIGGFMAGPGGFCVCPRCGYTTPHTIGTPCYQQTCPKCGKKMTRGA